MGYCVESNQPERIQDFQQVTFGFNHNCALELS
jgi:hypothetical protein